MSILLPSALLALAATATMPLPARLHDTGLYRSDGAAGRAALEPDPALLAFSPQYPLWSDGARKRRWISLPPGSFIDATRANAWEFPVGTRLWKEFSLGARVETRYLERLADGEWRFAAYAWSADGREATLVPPQGLTLAVPDAPGGRYAIPSESDCRACHEGAPSPVLGFSALQLSGDRDPLAPHAEAPDADAVDLAALVARGLVRNLAPSLLATAPRIAGAPLTRAALGYLHGNCGHCHADPAQTGAAVPVATVLAQDVTDPARGGAVLRALLAARSRYTPAGLARGAAVVAPGAAHASVLALRMASRDARVQMPPLGSAIPDPDGLALIQRWIEQELPSTHQELHP